MPAPAIRVVPAGALTTLAAGLRAALLSDGVPVAPLPPDPGPALAAVRPDESLEPTQPPALVVTTSGSTGAPKAVLLGRTAVTASAAATREVLGGAGTWHLALPTHYVAGAMVVARAVLDGGDPVAVGSRLQDLHPRPGRNYLSVIPTQLARARREPEVVCRLARFDAVLVGGAALPEALAAEYADRGVRLVATYGMSETCGGCVYNGRPLPGVEVGFGAADRILLTGPVAFSGYRGRPDLTADTLDGQTVRTQDRGRWRDGRLQVLGRLDDVVVSGGVNVDLAELERRLRAATGTDELVVVGVPDAEWGTRVVVVGSDPRSLTELLAALPGTGLAAAARPKEKITVTALPLLSTGKVDRARCRALASDRTAR